LLQLVGLFLSSYVKENVTFCCLYLITSYYQYGGDSL